MRILVVHQNPYAKVRYDQVIDHNQHEVVYAGSRRFLNQVPPEIRHQEFELPSESGDLSELERWMNCEKSFDRILTRAEVMLVPVAQLRQKFHVPGIDVDTSLRYRDKTRMKAAVAAKGLRVPFYQEGACETNPAWIGMTILKPKDGSGSRGVEKFATSAEAMKRLRTFSERERQNLQVEEYVSGPIFHIDGYRGINQNVLSVVSRYINTCLDFDRGLPLGSFQVENKEIQEFAEQCLQALGGEQFAFHLEVILTDSGPVFLECAARVGGADVLETTRLRTGTHLHWLDIASDMKCDIAKQFLGNPSQDFYGWFLFPGHIYQGHSVHVEVPPDLLNDSRLFRHHILAEEVSTSTKASYQAGQAPFSGIVQGRTSDQVRDFIDSLFNQVYVESRDQ